MFSGVKLSMGSFVLFMHLNYGFFKFSLGNRFGEKNQNNPNATQICFETYNSFQTWCDMNLNCGFFKFQLGNRFGEKIKIIQIQPRFVLKLSIHFKFYVT